MSINFKPLSIRGAALGLAAGTVVVAGSLGISTPAFASVTTGHYDIVAEVSCTLGIFPVIDDVVVEEHGVGPLTTDVQITDTYQANGALATALGVTAGSYVPAANPGNTALGLEIGFDVEYDAGCLVHLPVTFTWDTVKTSLPSGETVVVWDDTNSSTVFTGTGGGSLSGSLSINAHQDYVFAFSSATNSFELAFNANGVTSPDNVIEFTF